MERTPQAMPTSKLFSCLSFRGRASRKAFWLASLSSVLALAAVFGISAVLYPLGSNYAGPSALFTFIIVIAVAWVMLAVQARRWHDLGETGWMVLANFTPGIPALANVILTALGSDSAQGALNQFTAILSVVVFVRILWSMGFQAGKAEPNRFGAAPAPAARPFLPVQAPSAAAKTVMPSVAKAATLPPAATAAPQSPRRTERPGRMFWKLVFATAMAIAVAGAILFTSRTQILAWLGNANACQTLAWQYRDGHGGSQDIAKAVKWFEKAAAKGSIKAEYDLGVIYYYGIGVEEDDEKAGDLFASAASAGYAPAMVMSGMLLADDDPGSDAARMLWEKAARLQNPWAESLLGSAYLARYSDTQDTDDIVAALYWMESAHRHGVEPVGGLLRHVWATLDPEIKEEVTERVFKHLEEGPPDVATAENDDGGKGEADKPGSGKEDKPADGKEPE